VSGKSSRRAMGCAFIGQGGGGEGHGRGDGHQWPWRWPAVSKHSRGGTT
jgi:hypothetical protein